MVGLQPSRFFYFRGGRYADASLWFRRPSFSADSVRVYTTLSGVFKVTGCGLSTAFRVDRSSSDGAYTNLGNLEYYVGNYRAAAAAFEEATKLTPGKYLYWANLGDAYRWTPELASRAPEAYEKAARLAEGELALNPDNAAAHATLAICDAKLGRMAPARHHIQRARRSNRPTRHFSMRRSIAEVSERATRRSVDSQARESRLGRLRSNGSPSSRTSERSRVREASRPRRAGRDGHPQAIDLQTTEENMPKTIHLARSGGSDLRARFVLVLPALDRCPDQHLNVKSSVEVIKTGTTVTVIGQSRSRKGKSCLGHERQLLKASSKGQPRSRTPFTDLTCKGHFCARSRPGRRAPSFNTR